MSLWPHQAKAIEDLRTALSSGYRKPLLVAPTGAGKTRIFTAVILSHLEKGGRVLFLAHRRELIRQAAARLVRDGLPQQLLRMVQSGGPVGDRNAPVTVASIPTLARHPEWMPAATLVCADEAHHILARTWTTIANYYQSAIVIGATATPCRLDGGALGDIFDTIVPVSSIGELTDAGTLVPCRVLAPADSRTELAADPVEAYLEHAAGQRAVIFCPNVISARDCADRLVAAGVPAACVEGGMASSRRDAALSRLASGDITVLTNCMVLTEGWDEPSITCCILGRACTHVGTYLQIVGRVLRAAPGKQSALLLDLKGACHRHGLPDEPREYSLTGDPIRTANALPPLMQCRKCGAVYRPSPVCPSCGTAKKPPELPSVRRERLTEIASRETADQRKAYWAKLCEQARTQGYRRGWAFHRYRAKYSADPAPERDEFNG